MPSPILIVEDSPSLRAHLHRLLVSRNYSCVEAEDGQAALDLIARQKVSLVITDLNMPRLDGLSLCAALRECPETSELPLIVCTTEASLENRRSGQRSRIAAWVQKPYNEEVLLRIVGVLAT